MIFDTANIICEPKNEGRNFYGCIYKVGDKELFYERTYTPTGFLRRRGHRNSTLAMLFTDALRLIDNPIEQSEQWVSGGLDKALAVSLAEKYGAEAREEYYCEGKYFLVFTDADKALAFCQTQDFDETLNAEAEVMT